MEEFLCTHLDAVVEALAALLGFFAVAWTLYKEKKIKKIDFVSTYNFNFLTSEEFIGVEQLLEAYYQHYKESDKPDSTYDVKFKADLFGTSKKTHIITKKHQKVINYLVYLESFTPLIQKEHVKLQDIDNLFGYRYFIAMNNPVVQENELLPESSYYQNCLSVYRQWKKYRRDRHLPIPLDEYDLEKSALIFSKNRLSAHRISNETAGIKGTWIIKDNTGLFTPTLSTKTKGVKMCLAPFLKIKYFLQRKTVDFCKIKIKSTDGNTTDNNISPLSFDFKYKDQISTLEFCVRENDNTITFSPLNDQTSATGSSSNRSDISSEHTENTPESNKTETSK